MLEAGKWHKIMSIVAIIRFWLLLVFTIVVASASAVDLGIPENNGELSPNNNNDIGVISPTTNLVFYGRQEANNNGAIVSSPKMGLATKARLKMNRKRCRYSEHEIDELNKRNLNRVLSSSSASGGGYYARTDEGEGVVGENERPVMAKHQPKVRDQFQTWFGSEASKFLF